MVSFIAGIPRVSDQTAGSDRFSDGSELAPVRPLPDVLGGSPYRAPFCLPGQLAVRNLERLASPASG